MNHDPDFLYAPIQDALAIEQFCESLHSIGWLYHFDDDPHAIEWDCDPAPSEAQMTTIATRVSECLERDKEHTWDVVTRLLDGDYEEEEDEDEDDPRETLKTLEAFGRHMQAQIEASEDYVNTGFYGQMGKDFERLTTLVQKATGMKDKELDPILEPLCIKATEEEVIDIHIAVARRVVDGIPAFNKSRVFGYDCSVIVDDTGLKKVDGYVYDVLPPCFPRLNGVVEVEDISEWYHIIERKGEVPDGRRFYLCLGNEEWESDDLFELERRLAGWMILDGSILPLDMARPKGVNLR